MIIPRQQIGNRVPLADILRIGLVAGLNQTTDLQKSPIILNFLLLSVKIEQCAVYCSLCIRVYSAIQIPNNAQVRVCRTTPQHLTMSPNQNTAERPRDRYGPTTGLPHRR